MKSFKEVTAYIAIGIAVLTTAGCIASYLWYTQERQKKEELEVQLATLEEQEKRSTVMQSINAQMEEIATQQQQISDEQREQAVQQTIIANQMREQAEVERQNAIEAEQRAVEASEVAKSQRLIAEQRQQQAEYSRRVADTLTYLAMARSLASEAITQYRTGNKDLASLLSYAAYTFTNRYHGDIYQLAIYESLSLTSESSRKWSVSKGYVMKTIPMDDVLSLSVTTYGEILQHKMTEKGLQSKTVFSDKKYDFRDLSTDYKGTYFALSNTSVLLVGKGKNMREISIEGAQRPFRIFAHQSGKLHIIAENSIHEYDIKSQKMKRILTLPFRTTIAGEDYHHIYLFTKDGKMYDIGDGGEYLKERELPFKANVTSYTFSLKYGIEAYGTNDGTIYLMNSRGKVSKLIGHRSKVSRVKFEGDLLFSSSYDGTVRFWKINNSKIEPMTILNSNQWVISFVFDRTKNYIFTASKNGNYTETLISPRLMADKINKRLKRELTKEEWDFYIGRNIPYETFKGKEGR